MTLLLLLIYSDNPERKCSDQCFRVMWSWPYTASYFVKVFCRLINIDHMLIIDQMVILCFVTQLKAKSIKPRMYSREAVQYKIEIHKPNVLIEYVSKSQQNYYISYLFKKNTNKQTLLCWWQPVLLLRRSQDSVGSFTFTRGFRVFVVCSDLITIIYYTADSGNGICVNTNHPLSIVD